MILIVDIDIHVLIHTWQKPFERKQAVKFIYSEEATKLEKTPT